MTTAELSALTSNDSRILDRVQALLEQGQVSDAMSLLFAELGRLQRQLEPGEWDRFVQDVILPHPVLELVHQAPLCRHSFEQPRGYPGDAELIDYLYGLREPENASAVGSTIHDWCFGRAPVRGVRHRREWLASILDEEAARLDGKARVLSVACGHLREGRLSGAFCSGWFEEVVALDADASSLAVARASQPELVTPIQLSVARLPNRAKRLGTFDLIYSAGLYDYLEDELAHRLTASLFSLLRAGGRLVVGNFLAGVADSSFMEAFMGWKLFYRTREQIEGLLVQAPSEEIGELSFHQDPYGVFGYVTARRTFP